MKGFTPFSFSHVNRDISICMVLEQTMEYIGLNQMVHGVKSQMAVNGCYGLLFMTTTFMVSEVTRQFGQQALFGVPGPKLPLQ